MQGSKTEVRPARPLRPKAILDESGDALTLRYRHREWGRGGFLIVWLIGWTVGCVFMADMVIRQPTPTHFLFAVPFGALWFFAGAMLLRGFLQREEFSLSASGAVFIRHTVIQVKRREISPEEILRFDIFQRVADSETGRAESGLELVTLGQPLRFVLGLDSAELLWLQERLQRQLEEVREQLHLDPPADERAEESPAPLTTTPLEPPSHCSWERVDDLDSLTFCQSGWLSLSALGIVLFINLSWNGLLSLFLGQLWAGKGDALEGFGWWGLFCFLIPFEVVGLALFVTLIFILLEPARRTRWQIGRAEITCRLTWFGLGRRWDYLIERLDRIEVLNAAPQRQQRTNQVTVPWGSTGGTFWLSLLDTSGAQACSIHSLTKGEARWMADVIRQERPRWFR